VYEAGCTTVRSSKGWLNVPNAWNPWTGRYLRLGVEFALD